MNLIITRQKKIPISQSVTQSFGLNQTARRASDLSAPTDGCLDDPVVVDTTTDARRAMDVSTYIYFFPGRARACARIAARRIARRSSRRSRPRGSRSRADRPSSEMGWMRGRVSSETYLGGRLGGHRGGENGRHGGRAVCARSRVRAGDARGRRSVDRATDRGHFTSIIIIVPTWTPGVPKKKRVLRIRGIGNAMYEWIVRSRRRVGV